MTMVLRHCMQVKLGSKRGGGGRCKDLHAGAQELGGVNGKLRWVMDCTCNMVAIGVRDVHGSALESL
jgi:hypothetical protein